MSELLLAWNIALTIAVLVQAHYISRTRLFIRGNGKEKKANGLWMLDMHDYRSLQHTDDGLLETVERHKEERQQADTTLLVSIKQIERFLAKKHGEAWPFEAVKD